MIQNKFQLNSSKSSGPRFQHSITLLVAYICLSPGFLKMSGISRALTDWLQTGGLTSLDEGQLRLGAGKVHVNLLLGQIKKIVGFRFHSHVLYG